MISIEKRANRDGLTSSPRGRSAYTRSSSPPHCKYSHQHYLLVVVAFPSVMCSPQRGSKKVHSLSAPTIVSPNMKSRYPRPRLMPGRIKKTKKKNYKNRPQHGIKSTHSNSTLGTAKAPRRTAMMNKERERK